VPVFCNAKGCSKSKTVTTDRVREEVMQSAPSVLLFPLHALNRVTTDLGSRVCVGHDHSLAGIAIEGHGQRSKRAVGATSNEGNSTVIK